MLKHHIDENGNSQLHEIYESCYPEIPTGYGKIKEEAFEQFKGNLGIYINDLNDYYNGLEIGRTISVDCSGNKLNK